MRPHTWGSVAWGVLPHVFHARFLPVAEGPRRGSVSEESWTSHDETLTKEWEEARDSLPQTLSVHESTRVASDVTAASPTASPGSTEAFDEEDSEAVGRNIHRGPNVVRRFPGAFGYFLSLAAVCCPPDCWCNAVV